MESMGKKPRRRRSFTPEFKAEIVELCQRGDRSVGQVAKDFDLTETAVREWVKQAERDAGTRQRRRPDQRGAAGAGASCGGRTAGCARTWRSSSGRRLSSRRRPGERLPVHRGGESAAAQRQAGVRAAGGLPCRLLSAAWPGRPGAGPGRRRAGRARSGPCTRNPGAATAPRGCTPSCAAKGTGTAASGSPG